MNFRDLPPVKILIGVSAVLGATLAIVAFLYGGDPAEHLRPWPTKGEVAAQSQQIATNTEKLLWLEFYNLEDRKKRRPLTPEECQRYLKIAKILGVPASC